MSNSKTGSTPLSHLERRSLKKIYEEHSKLVFSIACGFFGPMEAEDVTQDFFTKKVVAALRNGKNAALEDKAYISRMTKNYCLDKIKPMKFKKMSEAISTHDLSDTLGQTQEEEIDRKMDLVTSLSCLDEKEKKVINLYLEGCKGKEIEKITGLSNASKKRKAIEKKLAKLLKNK
jgi:RNA polymerase sigma factor, sigma-70 family